MQVELSDGAIEYTDTGGEGPVIVLLHGLLMDGSLWDGVVDKLADGHRCVVPLLPLGAHRQGMRADADLSLPGIASLAAEFLDKCDLRDVTLIGNDTGGAVVQLMVGNDRIKRIVLVSCDAFDNFPPGLTGKTVVLAGKLPPAAFGMFMQQLRLRPVRRLPIAFGWLTKRGDATTRQWLDPVLSQPEIRMDAVKALRAISAHRNLLTEAAKRLPEFNNPALVVWASEDKVMPPEHGKRLAELFPHGQLAEVADSYTLIPLDQPAELARLIGEFVSGVNAGRV